MAVRRYQIREKIFSLGDNFKIKDEIGQDVYTVRSKLFSAGDKLVLEDMAGNRLIKVQQELFHLHPTYKILSARDGDPDRELAIIKKKFSFLHHKFDIDSAYGQYSLEGEDIFAHSFALRKAGVTVASVSKKFISLSDTYGVEIVTDEDQAFILALTIVLDQVLYDNDSQHHHQ
ncbi:unnamed protein product [Rotaria socialis]|uniref:Uncharacterized protein n=3 Tax=Rotaria socialis TaxID=392032 RepID=A0A818IAS6_9BILA|nr:unnamed protein product [Rotaria socialis]CAF3364467.1 unnamed protein product [Rotaria socialis]CAF3385098.1 unnamed protein product [Rotaria socialis]CAF3407693.1 unnamed protein product [Rotaria socialis]CAF3520586.1 unnamed protein product [Rotaria socialis]